MHSSSVTVQGSCENCNAPFEIDAWAVIDADERPDLIRRIFEGSLSRFSCRSCGIVFELTVPLLIYRPREGGLRALFYVLHPEWTRQQNTDYANGLISLLLEALGADHVGDPVGVMPVPRPILPQLLARSVKADLRTSDSLLDLSGLPARTADAYLEMLHMLR
jgi:hypothetical protein